MGNRTRGGAIRGGENSDDRGDSSPFPSYSDGYFPSALGSFYKNAFKIIEIKNPF